MDKRVSCEKEDGPVLRICTSYDVFLRKKLPFVGRSDCTCVNFSGVNFLIAINFL